MIDQGFIPGCIALHFPGVPIVNQSRSLFLRRGRKGTLPFTAGLGREGQGEPGRGDQVALTRFLEDRRGVRTALIVLAEVQAGNA